MGSKPYQSYSQKFGTTQEYRSPPEQESKALFGNWFEVGNETGEELRLLLKTSDRNTYISIDSPLT
ncbi:hypothetical protein GCM10025776_17180 [Corallincola platygyrae]